MKLWAPKNFVSIKYFEDWGLTLVVFKMWVSYHFNFYVVHLFYILLWGWTFAIIYILYSHYHPKIIGHILGNKKKIKCVDICTINHSEMMMKIENRYNRYDINSPRSSPRYSKYKNCLRIMMLICMKQHLSNIWKAKFNSCES